MSAPTVLLNTTQRNILAALDLMKTRGRARNRLMSAGGRFCPLGAIAAVRTGQYEQILTSAAYTDSPEVVAVAQAIYEKFGSPGASVFTLTDFTKESNKYNWIHAYNDEIKEDAVVWALMERGAEIARGSDG